MAKTFESVLMVPSDTVNQSFRPAFSDREFYSDVIMSQPNHTGTVVIEGFLTDDAGNFFIDDGGDLLIAAS